MRRHLEACEPCAREHAELATIPALLDVADSADAVPMRPPPRLEEAVLDRFARERRGARVRPRAASPAAAPRAGAGSRRPRRRCACGLAALAVRRSPGRPFDEDGGGTAERADGASSPDQSAPDRPRVYRVALAGEGPLPHASRRGAPLPGRHRAPACT